MREIAPELAAWRAAGTSFAIATVVQTWKSSPRLPGAAMAVSDAGEVIGSVSGGCVEGAVYELAREVLESGVPVLQTYGVSDDDAFAVGLTCGGILDILVQPVDARHFTEIPEVLDAIAQRRSIATGTVISDDPSLAGELVVPGDAGQAVLGDLGNADLQARVVDAVRDMLADDRTGMIHLSWGDADEGHTIPVFIQSFAAPPLMVVYGAIDFARAVVGIGKFLGYHVVLCDARGLFATSKRFPEADEVIVRWPHVHYDSIADQIDDRTVICVLTHDHKFDVPVLQRALAGPAAYVGAMGSRRTHSERMSRLREAGVPQEHLDRLCSPIGLDLGAATPEETAVAIAAEFIMLRRGGTPTRLVHGELAIHR